MKGRGRVMRLSPTTATGAPTGTRRSSTSTARAASPPTDGGTVYVLHPPNLTAYRDRNGDCTADDSVDLVKGIGVDPFGDAFTRDNTNDGGGWDTRFHYLPPNAGMGYPSPFRYFREEHMPSIADYGGGSGTAGLWVQDPGIPGPGTKRGGAVHAAIGELLAGEATFGAQTRPRARAATLDTTLARRCAGACSPRSASSPATRVATPRSPCSRS